MQCPNCEAENRDDAKFCDECGFPLSGAIARAAGGASPTGADTDRDFENFEETLAGEEPEHPSLQVDEEFGGAEAAVPAGRIGAWGAQGVQADEAHDADRADGFSTMELPTAPSDEPADFAGGVDGEWSYDRAFTPADDFFADEPFDDAFGTADYGTAALNGGNRPGAWPADMTMQMPKVNGPATEKSRDFMASSAKVQQKARKRAIIIGVVIAIAVALVAAIVTFALGIWGGKVVPDVTGMTESDARTVLMDEGFTVRSTQVKSDDTEGLVLLMDPGAGSRAPEGSEIVIHIATARYVPDVVGKTADEAQALFNESGYENVRFETQKSNDEENIVLAVKPEAGTRAKSGMEIVVTISEAYRVPDITNMSVDEARQAIKDAGLTPEAVYVDTTEYVDGTIIGTTPEAGAKVSEGDYVTISIARTRGIELEGLTEELLAPGNTVTIGGYDYDIESLTSVSYQGDDVVSFTATGRPKITFFGETLYASSSQTIQGQVAWSSDNTVISIS